MTTSHQGSDGSPLRTAAILVGVIAVLYLAREILIPFAFAITLTLILAPGAAWLQKMRLGRVPAVLLIMILGIAIAGGIGLVIFNQLVEVANELPKYRENVQNKMESIRSPVGGALGRAAKSVEELAEDVANVPPEPTIAPPTRTSSRNPLTPDGTPLPVTVIQKPLNDIQSIRNFIQPVLAPMGVLGIVLIFTVFMLIEQTDLRNRLLRLAGLERLNLMTQALDDATHRVSRYLLMQLLVNTTFGTLSGIGLYFIGVPYAALWGTVAAILRIVPYVGAPVAAILPFMLSLAVFDNWVPPLLVLLIFAALELTTSNLVEPWLYGVHTGISSLALLLSAVFWAALWGPAGLILSTPLTVCVVVLGQHLPQLAFLNVLFGDQPVLGEEAQVYQRLLAMDDQEARSVATQYLKDHTLIQLYDAVIVPALTLAEQDRHKGALEPGRKEFLYLSIKEILAELAEDTANPARRRKGRRTEERPEEKPREINPAGRVLCIPSSDEADEITAAMLAQLLEHAGHIALSLPLDEAMLHTVGMVRPDEKDVFCISALPPYAFAGARTLSQQLQVRFPKTKVVIGVWGFTGDPEKALQRFETPIPDKLVTTLSDAILFVNESVASKNPASVA